MIRHRLCCAAAAALATLAGSAFAQTALTLDAAIARARSASAEARLADAAVRSAATRIPEARAAYLPQIDAAESWTRGNEPVYVFGSLLNQRRFGAADFALDALNHPDALTNYRASIGMRELIWNGGAREAGVRTAALGEDAARAGQAQVQGDLALATAQAFGAVLRYESAERAAVAAIAAAEGDLARAKNRQDVGLVTAADVAAFEVRVAAVRAERAHANAEGAAARARLNELMGAPLDAAFVLDPAAPAVPPPDPAADRRSLGEHPDLRAASLRGEIAEAARTEARAAFLPSVGVTAGWAWNGASFDTRASSWVVAAEVRWNLFNGLADRARAARAGIEIERAAIDRERVQRALDVEVRAARARLEAARASEAASRTAVAAAAEAERITRDRYEHGMADVTSLLHASEDVQDATARATAAAVDVLVQSAALRRALGISSR